MSYDLDYKPFNSPPVKKTRKPQPRGSRAIRGADHVGYWYPKSASTYKNHGCRCDGCTAAASKRI